MPYKNPANPTNPYVLQQPPPKSELPPLLPTPRGSFLNPYQPKYPYSNQNTKTFANKPDINTPKSGKPTTREEKDERRKKGLCMWCGIKYFVGHTCPRSQLYQLLVEDSAEVCQEEEFADCSDTLEELGNDSKENHNTVISLHAVFGTVDCQTMRKYGKIKNTLVVILVDSGSTNNFMDQWVVKQLGCKINTIPGIGVSVANGDKLWVNEVCPQVQWE